MLSSGFANQQGAMAVSEAPLGYEPLETCFAEPPVTEGQELSVECGYVVVPETRGSNDGRTLKLGFMRVKSGQGAARSPLFILDGGPGQTAITQENLALLQPKLLGQILQDRDIVLLEQRGTRNTSVFLACQAVNASAWTAHERALSEEETEKLQVELFKQCIDDFKTQGVNLDSYNSVENAADVDAARRALGYQRIIYYGASYGSQLGQHVMRDFPASLEAVILDGANSLSRKSWVEDRALDAQWGIDNLTKLCNRDQVCRENYDIPSLVAASLALFADGPLPYRFTDPSNPALTIEGVVTEDDMVGLIYEMQGNVIGAFSLPATLQLLSEGGVDQVVEVLGQRKGGALVASRDAPLGIGMAMLMHAAMVCSDDPVHSLDDVNMVGTGPYATRFGSSTAREYVLMCSVAGIEELPDSTDENVRVDVPVLLLSGSLDVATPAFRSQIVADALPNATHLIFPGRTHVQLSGVNLCAFDVMTQFTRNPDARLDTSCMQDAPVMGFVLSDGTMSTDQGEAKSEQ
jgi:pimeloyl-ACP methyl ester carboxylesterase